MLKNERREQARRKKVYGMKVVGRSVITIQNELNKRAEKAERKSK
jgi:hypothetical protein